MSMNLLLKRIAIVTLAIFTAGCGKDTPDLGTARTQSESTSQEISALATSYEDLRLMTPDPVFVNPELATLCIGASKEMVEHARIDKGPHANCSVRIFMNELASTAFAQQTTYPVGSIIIKEKNMLGYRTKTDTEWQGTGNGVGGMIKRDKGFDETNANWEYFYFENASSIESGKMKSCIECHQKSRKSDFVFGNWSKSDDENSHGY